MACVGIWEHEETGHCWTLTHMMHTWKVTLVLEILGVQSLQVELGPPEEEVLGLATLLTQSHDTDTKKKQEVGSGWGTLVVVAQVMANGSVGEVVYTVK